MRAPITLENVSLLSAVAQVRIGWITTVLWSPDGETIAIAGGTQTRIYIRSFGMTPSYILEGHDAPVKDLSFSARGDMLASVGADGQAIVWSMDATPPQHLYSFTVMDSLNSVSFSTDSRSVIAGAGKGEIHLWNLRQGDGKTLPYPHVGEVNAVRWYKGHVYSAGHDGELFCRDMSDVRSAPILLAAQSDRIRDFAIQDADRITYTVSKDGTLRGWTQTGDMLFRILAHEGGADCVSIHPSGRLLATGGRDNTARIWDVKTLSANPNDAEPVAVLRDHRKPVLTLAFNPQGTMLLTGGGDNITRLWSVEERNNAGN